MTILLAAAALITGITVAGSGDPAVYLKLDGRFYRVDETTSTGPVLSMPIGTPPALAVFETAALRNCRRLSGGQQVTSNAILLYSAATEIEYLVARLQWSYKLASPQEPAVFSVNTASGDVVCDGEDADPIGGGGPMPGDRIMTDGFEVQTP